MRLGLSRPHLPAEEDQQMLSMAVSSEAGQALSLSSFLTWHLQELSEKE